MLYLKACSYFGDGGTATAVNGPVWVAQGPPELSESDRCPQNGSFQLIADKLAAVGSNAQWHTVTPPTIGITGAFTPANAVLVAPPSSLQHYSASYFWNGGLQSAPAENNCCGGMDYGLGINRNDLGGSRYFGFQISCTGSTSCPAPTGELMDVRGLQLTAQDNTAPTISSGAGNELWHQTSDWVRGIWPSTFSASDDSGICDIREIVDGRLLQGPAAPPNQSSWTQCPTPVQMNEQIDTRDYSNGPMSLALLASDAASPSNVSAQSQTLEVDNSPVSVTLAGPTGALTTSGTQYVTATGSAGPSGVRDIQCSVDGSRFVTYPGSSAQVPVSGTGGHTVQCIAENNAIDASGQPAQSPLANWHLSILEPAVSEVTFGTRLVDALRCHRATVRVKTRARWVVVTVSGQRVRVHLKAVTRIRHVTRCHPRVKIRKVRVGKKVVRRRIVLLPRRVQINVKRVGFGREATVGGWVALSDGTALPNVPVRVMTATDNGRNRWRVAAVVQTNAQGLWQAQIKPGPSRLITAAYTGSATTASATSGTVRILSPTRVSLAIRPGRTRWGSTIKISGRVLGGNIPAGKLLRLRIGTAGIYSTVGIPDINRTGRYRTTWTFASGRGTVHYWFSVSTLPEADYPYMQSTSRRVYVTVHG